MRRDHVLGQIGAEPCAQPLRVRFAVAVGHHIPGQHRGPGAAPVRDHRGLGHAGQPQQGVLHLAQLDAVAADLDLVVQPPQEVQVAVGQPPYEVARTVQPLPRGEGVGDEALRGQLRTAQIAAGQPPAADVQLAGHADRHRVAPLVEHVRTGPGDGRADRRQPVVGGVTAHPQHGRRGQHRGLGRAVVVDEGEGGVRGQPAADHVGAGEHVAQPALVDTGLVQYGFQPWRRDHGERDAVVGDPLGEQVRVVELRVGDEPQARPGGEVAPLLQHGRVEARRHQLRGPVRRAHLVVVAVPPQEVQHIAVLDLHTLGLTRGTRGVEHVRQIVAAGFHAGRAVHGLPLGVLHVQRPAALGDRAVRQVPLGDHDGHPGVAQHVRGPVRGERRVQRQTGAARLEDGELPHGHLHAARGPYGHHRARTHPARHETVGQRVGPRVQLAEGQLPVGADHGGRPRRPARLLGEERVHAPVAGVGRGRGGVAPLLGDQPPFPLRHQRQPAQGALRPGGHRGQQHQQVFRHPLDGGAVEQVGVVLHPAGQRAVPVLELQAQVEHGGGPGDGDLLGPQPGGADGLHPLEGHRHLEQRGAAGIPLRLKLLDQAVEGQLLVGERLQDGAPGLGQELRDRHLRTDLAAQDEGVDEVAQHVLQLDAVAPGDDRAHRHVRLTAVAGQQQLHRRHQRAEQRGLLLPAQLGYSMRQFGGDGEDVLVARRGTDGRTGTVGRQLQRAHPGQPLPPVLQILARPGAAAPLLLGPLPPGVVRVAHRQRVQARRRARRGLLVQGAELPRQHVLGPAVGDDVVHVQQQDVFPLGQAHQRHPQQRPVAQVEGGGRVFAQRPLQLRAALGRRAPGQVQVAHRNRPGGVHPLGALAVHDVEGGAQRLVALHQRPQRALGRPGVQLAGQPQRQGRVVLGAAGLVLVQEPQPSLSVRQGQRPVVVRPARGGPGGGTAQALGERGHGGGLEQRPYRHLAVQDRPDAADQAGGEQGVPAQVEEAVVDADPVDAQHLAEQVVQLLLAGHAGRAPGGGRCQGGHRQRGAVGLAVRGQRQLRQGHDHGRDHVVGQRGRDVLPQPRGFRPPAGGRDGVRQQPHIARTDLLGHHHGLGHVGVALQHRLDLAEFDAEAADLDLVVTAAQELQVAVGGPAGHVARAVQPRPRLARPGVGHEALGGEAGAALVAVGEPGPADVEVTGHAGGHRPQRGVQHVDPGVGDGPADGRSARSALQPRGGGPDRGLRRAVEVDGLGAQLPHGCGKRAGQRLTADGHPQSPYGLRLLLAQRVPQAGGGLHDGGAGGGDQLREGLWVADGVLVGEDQGGPAGQREVQLQGGDVEGDRGDRRPHVGGGERQQFAHRGQEVGQRSPADDHALGPAGRAGGVDDVRGLVGAAQGAARRLDRRGVRQRGQFPRGVRVVQYEGGGPARGQPSGGAGVGDDGDGSGVRQGVGDALGRVLRVDGQIRRSGLGDREQAGHQIGAAGEDEADERAGGRAPQRQRPGDAVGAGVQLRVAGGAARVHHGRCVGAGARPGLEEVGDRAVRYRPRGRVPPRQQTVALGVVQDVEGVERPLGGVGGVGQQPQDGLGHAARGRLVEQLAAVVDQDVHAARGAVPLLRHRPHVQVVRRAGGGHVPGVRRQIAEGVRGGHRRGDIEDDLAQRVPVQRPVRPHRLQQPRERQFAVGAGGGGRGRAGAHQLREVHPVRYGGAQHHGVLQRAHHVRFGACAGADGGAQREVPGRGEAAEGGGERGVQHGEHIGAGALGQCRDGPVAPGVQAQPEPGTGVRGDGRTGAVRRELELFRRPGQCVAPELQFGRGHRGGALGGAEDTGLPGRRPRVLRGPVPVRRTPATGAYGVGGGQVAQQGPPGRLVPRHPVQHQQQDVGVGGDGEHLGAQRDVTGQVEAAARRPGQLLVERVRVGGADGQPGERLVRGAPFGTAAAFVLGEDRTQQIVPGQQVAQRVPERGGVEGPGQPRGAGEGLPGTGLLETVQEPQPTLDR